MRVLIENRSIKNHLPSFEVTIEKNSKQTFYLRTKSKLTTSAEIEIYTKEYFNSLFGQYHNLLYMFYFGGIFIITIINLFLYIRLKDIIYLYYSGYTLFFTLWVSAYCGLILHTIVDGYAHEFYMVTSLFIMFLTLFSSEFLSVKNYLPKVHMILKAFAVTFAFLAILIVISFEPWFELMNQLASVIFFLLFAIAIYIWKKENDPNVKYYLFAMSIYMITISLMSGMVNGWIENNDINRYSFLFGSFFEIAFFSLVLTNRFYIAQNEKLTIQKELIDIKTKNEIVLEEEIKNRTQDISTLLKDKELLLRELYHRVKNNFHTVITLLWLEHNNSKDKETKDLFLKIIGRIKSMSTVHQYFYNSDSLVKFNSKEYIEKSILEIEKIYTKENITIKKHINSFIIDINTALSISMIINELITNSIKHKKENSTPIIELFFTKEKGRFILTVKDNGIGFDTKKEYNSLGLKLIEQFSNKLLNSNFQFTFNSGTTFTLTFQISE